MKSRERNRKQDRRRFLRSSRSWGLQAHMRTTYVRTTIVIVFVLEVLNVLLLTNSINYTLAHQPAGYASPSIASYPFQGALVMFMLILLVAPLIGGWFGTMTTSPLVRRVHTLVNATTAIANGDYRQRVSIAGQDEIAQLEHQFNRMAEQLAEHIAQRQALSEQNARLAERARISRELHDAISQDLFSLRMLSYGLQTALPADSEFQPQIIALEHITSNMLREMRALLLEMRPTDLEHLGLAQTLETMAQAYSTRLGIAVTTTLLAVSLTPQVEHALLRITQEALANAVRHANATIITICLAPQEDMIRLSIEDNGKGFTSDECQAQHGLGLRLMQERVHELRGTFILHTTPGEGTRIQVCLPREDA